MIFETLKQVSVGRWYHKGNRRPFRFVESETTGWLRGNISVSFEYHKITANIVYSDGSSGYIDLFRSGDTFRFQLLGDRIRELDVDAHNKSVNDRISEKSFQLRMEIDRLSGNLIRTNV